MNQQDAVSGNEVEGTAGTWCYALNLQANPKAIHDNLNDAIGAVCTSFVRDRFVDDGEGPEDPSWPFGFVGLLDSFTIHITPELFAAMKREGVLTADNEILLDAPALLTHPDDTDESFERSGLLSGMTSCRVVSTVSIPGRVSICVRVTWDGEAE